MSISESLSRLVDTFQRDLELARALTSVNPEDDLAMKASIVGFSYNSPTHEWCQEHFDFVKARLDRDYHDRELANYGGNAESVKHFFALGIGYLLGLYQKQLLSDAEFKEAEQQLPGLIMLNASRLTAQTSHRTGS